MFTTRVDRNFEAAHTNGPPGGRCATMHGHSWQVSIEVDMPDSSLDEWGWTMDFGDLKRIIDRYDHQTLNDYFEKPSAENIAVKLWNDVIKASEGRAEAVRVVIAEGHGNTLSYDGPDA